MDFFKVRERVVKRSGAIEIYPDFNVVKSKDLMIRGKAFYAIWDEEKGFWSTDEYDAQRLIDKELWDYKEKHYGGRDVDILVNTTKEYSSKSWSTFKRFIKDIGDNYHVLDNKLTFADTKTKRSDYASKCLGYSLADGSIDAYDEIISTLYSVHERKKIEWAIGAIIAGDAKDIQKFIVLYGEAGTGKSTILNIIQKLFDGYYTMFEAKALASSNNNFSTEVFKNNPLVAIQHDGDLSRIEDNTKLNSIIAHEEMVMHEKFKSDYISRLNCFLFMATNRPVKITDAKSGIIRRLIDVRPTGRKLPPAKFFALMEQVNYELGAIAAHCLKVYRECGKNYYADYRPNDMQLQTDVFYNFVDTYYDEFKKDDGVALGAAYSFYKQYCDLALVEYKLPMYKFREELKNYFEEYYDRLRINDKQVRSYYKGFKWQKFNPFDIPEEREEEEKPSWLTFDKTLSLFDDICADCPAQIANKSGTPRFKWKNVKTTLKDISTRELHYVKVPEEHIVIDFDIKDKDGNKCFEKNLEAATKWPPTYAELSKSEAGIHLHYIYKGDVTKLSRVYDDEIEVKVFTGDSSLRRRLTRCNDIPIATIGSGLPLKEEKTMVNYETIKSEKKLRELILRNMRKEIHPGTKPSVDFICKIIEDAYESGMHYDISDMKSSILAFAGNSTHHAQYCVSAVMKLHYHSDEPSPPVNDIENNEAPIVFYDVEVFPNLCIVNWKFEGEGEKVHRLINPGPDDISKLLKYRLIGFNCRRYDNHILWAIMQGYTNYQLFILSQKIVDKHSDNAMFREAYQASYTDVFDYASKKQSLKKWEIELKQKHRELGLKWDEPVPEELWTKVAEYCDNDVLATEAVHKARHADFVAREVLADLAGLTVNDTTNTLTTKIIFLNDRNPQSQFNYRFLGDNSKIAKRIDRVELPNGVVCRLDELYSAFDEDGRPIFPDYTFEGGKSIYRGEEVGEGGYVYAEPGMYTNVALLDISSMHPSSIVAEELFGPIYTARFKSLLDARIAIKHKDFDIARTMLDGVLAKYLEDESSADNLSQALKIAINSVYGLTSAKFKNPFKDPRNIDNIVAKRGALFMVNLKHEVQRRGFTVAHIKTDSIKIPNANQEIIDFVMAYGKLYGYNFEHEATYEKMCLVNDAVYICKVKEGKHAGEWSATGAQFQHPYVFKYLFSKEPIIFDDMCETKSVKSALYLDMNESLPEGEHNYIFVGKVGQFVPVVSGSGGGLLMREQNDKFNAVTGTKGYRWKEAETVKELGLEEQIDKRYFQILVDDAVANISQYGDFERFVSDEPIKELDIYSDELPF